MKLEHWGALYALAGLALAVALARRGIVSSPIDLALLTVAWPLYAPAVLSPRRALGLSPAVRELGRAIDAVHDPAWRPLLPTTEELSLLDRAVARRAARKRELDAVSTRDHAAGARLTELRARNERELVELADALDALRVELVALRFSDDAGDDARLRVQALLTALRDAHEGLRDGAA